MISVAQSCLTLCDTMDPPGSSVHGIFQAVILEWIVISSSMGSFQPRDKTPFLLHLLHWQVNSWALSHLGSPLFYYMPIVALQDRYNAAAAAKSLQSCLTLCNPLGGSPPGSVVPGIPQARTLEWVAISFSNAWKWKVKVKSLSHVWLFTTPWTAAYQAPPSMRLSRQECWSGLPLPSPR